MQSAATQIHHHILKPRAILPNSTRAAFSHLPSSPQIKKAFSQRRKVMRNALRPLWEPADVAAALSAVGLNEDARAQDLTLQEFGKLAWQLQAQEEGRQDGRIAEAAAVAEAGRAQPAGGNAGGEAEQD